MDELELIKFLKEVEENCLKEVEAQRLGLNVKCTDKEREVRRRRVAFDSWKMKVNGPAVIVEDLNKKTKYVSVADGEEFDLEKGIMLCLLKSLGYTFADIQYLCNKLEKQTKDREAQIEARNKAAEARAAAEKKAQEKRKYKLEKKARERAEFEKLVAKYKKN